MSTECSTECTRCAGSTGYTEYTGSIWSTVYTAYIFLLRQPRKDELSTYVCILYSEYKIHT